MKLIKMPSIAQFRNVVKDLSHVARYKGVDEDGNAVYDHSKDLPTVTFVGTVKLHGTNASICMNSEREMWCQSKKNVITVDKDNAGFAFYVESIRDYIESMLNEVFDDMYKGDEIEELCIYGEWAGNGIQNGVGISELDKSFYMFGIKFKMKDEEDYRWAVDPRVIFNRVKNPELRIFSIFDFETFEVDIDFENPSKAQEEIVKLTEYVENECPVAKKFGVSGIGEGIVFVGWFDGNRFSFKSKGDKHSNSKVKKLSKVDSELEQKKIDFANYATPSWRLEQMYNETFDVLNGGKGDVKRTGEFLKAVVSDVMKEEMDVLVERGLEPKDVNKHISTIARKWFMERLDKEAGL